MSEKIAIVRVASDGRERVDPFALERKQLQAAKERARSIYPSAKVRWFVEERVWIIIDPNTWQLLESAEQEDSLVSADDRLFGHKSRYNLHFRIGQRRQFSGG